MDLPVGNYQKANLFPCSPLKIPNCNVGKSDSRVHPDWMKRGKRNPKDHKTRYEKCRHWLWWTLFIVFNAQFHFSFLYVKEHKTDCLYHPFSLFRTTCQLVMGFPAFFREQALSA